LLFPYTFFSIDTECSNLSHYSPQISALFFGDSTSLLRKENSKGMST
jgi:hypothetical protein